MVAAFATGPNASYNKVGLGFGVFAFYAFVAVYGFGIDVCGVVWYSEIFPNHIRAKGICLSIATIALTDLVYLQATATAFANIGWHFYLVFICITFIGGIVCIFVLPEYVYRWAETFSRILSLVAPPHKLRSVSDRFQKFEIFADHSIFLSAGRKASH